MQPWKTIDHPQLGRVEVGGADVRFGLWNPPRGRLAEVCANQSKLFLRQSTMAPALAITDVFVVLAIAIIGSGLAMLALADRVSEFLQKNRKYEVLGLFILLIVAVVLLGEGGHVAHLTLFGYEVEAMSKTTFYFSLVTLVAVDVIQSGYQRKLERLRGRGAATT